MARNFRELEEKMSPESRARAEARAKDIIADHKLEHVVDEDHATVRVHPGTRALKGALASKKGKGMSFAQVRAAAGKAAVPRRGKG